MKFLDKQQIYKVYSGNRPKKVTTTIPKMTEQKQEI